VNQRPNGDPSETLRRIKDAVGAGFPVVADMRGADLVTMVQERLTREAG